jgi:predicted nucleic-acid-binding protein
VKGIDTNLLVRYIIKDDPQQAAVAVREIRDAGDRGEKLLIQPVVLCELVWVLRAAYGLARAEILPVLEQILRTAQFEVADKDTVWQALGDYRRGRGDFSDYYLGRANAAAGAATTLTFDAGLKGDPRFTVLGG